MRWIWLAVLGGGCVVGGGERSFTAPDVEVVRLRLSGGEIAVQGTDRTDVYVEWDGGGFGRNAQPDIYEQEGELMVDAAGGLLGGGDIWVEVPAGVHIDATVERGEVDIHLLERASVDACVAAGEVTVGVPRGAYRLELAGGVGELSSSGIIDDPDAPYRISVCVGAGEATVYSTN